MGHSVRNGKASADEEDRESEPTQVASLARNKAGKKTGRSADDPHRILGVRRGASAREIRAAYLGLVKELHPDGRAPDTDAHEADERLKAINDAYRKLRGPGGGTSAKGQKWRRRAGAVFVVGALTSAVPALVVLAVVFHYAGWVAPRAPAPDTGHKADAVSAYAKDPSAGRQSAWADAQREGTKEAWARFLEAYPEGEAAEKARQIVAALERADTRKRESIAWNAAEKGTKEDLERFLVTYPDGEHAPQAKGALAAIAAAEAQLQADQAAWKVADHAADKEALNKYLSDFPAGRHAEEAKQRVARLDEEESEKEEAAWLKAQQRNSKAGYADYLTSYPLGRRASDARTRIAELQQIEAKAQQARAQAVKEAKAVPVKSPPPPTPQTGATAGAGWPTADEPFVGVGGRLRH
jgi:curved DNA-binding protein CbpA